MLKGMPSDSTAGVIIAAVAAISEKIANRYRDDEPTEVPGNVEDYFTDVLARYSRGQSSAGGGQREITSKTSYHGGKIPISEERQYILLAPAPECFCQHNIEQQHLLRDRKRETKDFALLTCGRKERRSSKCKLEDAIDHDSYMDAPVTKYDKYRKKQILKQCDNQTPKRYMPQIDTFTTWSKLLELLRCIKKDRDPRRNPILWEMLIELIMWSWLPLHLPKRFPYTTVVQFNNDVQGLHHSFIRHMYEWEEFIDFNPSLMYRFSPIMYEIDKLSSVTGETSEETRAKSLKARDLLRNAMKDLSDSTYFDIKIAFVEIQVMLYRFIRDNLTFDNYIGRTLNENESEQLHFKVRTRRGEKRVMVVCVSDELFYSWREPGVHNDSRPIRTVVTVFFKPWTLDYSDNLAESKSEMTNKKRTQFPRE